MDFTSSTWVDTEDRDRFLNLFGVADWTWVTDLMTMPLEANLGKRRKLTPTDLLDSVALRVAGRLKMPTLDKEHKESLEELREALESNRAYAYAQFVIAVENAGRKAVSYNKYTAKKKPTEKQMALLRRLPYGGPDPLTCFEAKLLIDWVIRNGRSR